MKIIRLIILLAVIIFGFACFSYADDVYQRISHAHERIDSGIRSGSLTREEAHRLKNELNRVRDDEERMRADGRLNHRERARLDKELDRLERHISNLKSNDNVRDHGYRDHRR